MSPTFLPVIPPLPEKQLHAAVSSRPGRTEALHHRKGMHKLCKSFRVCVCVRPLRACLPALGEVTHHFLARLDVVRARGGAGRAGSSPPVK